MLLRILKFLFKGTVKKTLMDLENDPEVKEAIEGIERHSKELKKQEEEFEKKYGKKPRSSKLQGYPWKGGHI